ncbi:hypothetical protein AAG570_012399 [Ranatra chinensis]|uniref:Protein LLP homolog n=1 Tax=Ranatra chinensis TaxID=642074 RepID=A0ABD0YIV0_9HEMI
MGKSIRSKWKRKMRAVKRERYGKKELEKLKLVVANLNGTTASTDVEMKDLVTVLTHFHLLVVTKEDIQREKDEEMDDGRSVFNKKTLKDQYGNYPAWLNSRKKKKLVKRNKEKKRKTAKRLKSERKIKKK